MGRNLRIAVAFLGLSVVFVPSAFGQPWIEHDPINPDAPEEGDPPGGARDIERAHDVEPLFPTPEADELTAAG